MFLMCVLPLLSLADEAAIRKALAPKLGGIKIEGVQPAPVAGLWEVRFKTAEGMRIIYTDAEGTYVMQGNIVELRSGRDLTGERLRKLTAIKFESLPLDQAVKIQRGNGSRVMAMFSDPYCPACRQFERELSKVDNLTLYVFMFPVIRPANKEHSKAVWCSPDRAKAWLELAAASRPKVPDADPGCANPVDKLVEYGKTIGVSATPTLILPNGEKYSGGLAAEDLKDLLDQATAEASKKR
jgi:thiol:disulfide interchange protein DsbC